MKQKQKVRVLLKRQNKKKSTHVSNKETQRNARRPVLHFMLTFRSKRLTVRWDDHSSHIEYTKTS